MDKKSLLNRTVRFFKSIYLKLFRINDTPQKIAAGIGLGVFFGVMPGMGPVIALFFAFIFRVNRAGALIGSLLTNTWLIIPTFFLSVKTGSLVTGTNYEAIKQSWALLVKNFTWGNLFEMSLYEIAAPVITGYFIIALIIAVAAYLISLAIISIRNKVPGKNG